MKWWERKTEDDKWHLLLGWTACLFVVWIAAIVLTHMLGLNEYISDDIQLVVATGGIAALFLGQHQLRNGQRRIYDHVNHVEEDQIVHDGGEPASLGQFVRQIRDEQREFATAITDRMDVSHEQQKMTRLALSEHIVGAEANLAIVNGRLNAQSDSIKNIGSAQKELADKLDQIITMVCKNPANCPKALLRVNPTDE